MSGGGKGGATESSQQIDPRLAQGGVEILTSAFEAASQPYRPNQGMTIAAFTPQQQAAFQGANAAAEAFGLPSQQQGYQTMPNPEVGESGIRGYSTGDLYSTNVERSMSQQDMQNQADILQSYKNRSKKIERTKGPQPAGGGGK